MSAVNWLKTLYLARFSQPRGERPLYQAIYQARARSIVEIGMGSGTRAERMLRLAMRFHAPDQIRYAGVDLFEGRAADAPGITLKRAHQMLKSLGVQSTLAPGDPQRALARSANALVGADIVVVAADQSPENLAQAWFYVPRLLHEDSQVFVQQTGKTGDLGCFCRISRFEVEQLALATEKGHHKGSERKAA